MKLLLNKKYHKNEVPKYMWPEKKEKQEPS